MAEKEVHKPATEAQVKSALKEQEDLRVKEGKELDAAREEQARKAKHVVHEDPK